jgi:hypothetical protein
MQAEAESNFSLLVNSKPSASKSQSMAQQTTAAAAAAGRAAEGEGGSRSSSQLDRRVTNTTSAPSAAPETANGSGSDATTATQRARHSLMANHNRSTRSTSDNASASEVDRAVEEAAAASKLSRRPADHPFWQQRLTTYKPLFYDPRVSSVLLALIAVVFFPLGLSIVLLSANVSETEIQYDNRGGNCSVSLLGAFGANYNSVQQMVDNFNQPSTTDPQADALIAWAQDNVTRVCRDHASAAPAVFPLQITRTLQPPIYFYYRLTQYFSNTRQYIKSFSPAQLTGVCSQPCCCASRALAAPHSQLPLCSALLCCVLVSVALLDSGLRAR